MLEVATAPEGLTKSFTPQQREAVNAILAPLVDRCLLGIKDHARHVKEMDSRPSATWSKETPNVLFPYVEQAMLEDLIVMLQSHV